MIVQRLTEIQHRHGYLPRPALERLGQDLAVPLYRIQELVSFFPHLQTAPPAPIEVHVCRDMSCHLRGSAEWIKTLSQETATTRSDKSPRVEVCGVSCLGRCDRAPAVRIMHHLGDEKHADHLLYNVFGGKLNNARRVIEALRAGDAPDPSLVQRDADMPDVSESWRINPYAGQPPQERYGAVRLLASQIRAGNGDAERDRVLKALETAGLLGMGGAGGRAFKKWSEVRQATGEQKYVVCNGDESEPGTFKDRDLLLRTPHLVIEGVILGGLVVGANRGFIYVRHEYEEQIEALRAEIERARQLGACGSNVFDSGVPFNVEVFISPGGYICGEQTALIQAMEDRRAEPRNRPPELQTNGLWDMPTLLNNVETLAWTPAIVQREAGAWYAAQGAQKEFKGARFFSISGDLEKPGAYEVPIGITLGQLIDDFAGGMKGGRALKAVALSGPSGGFLPAKLPVSAFPPSIRARLAPGAETLDLRELQLDMHLFRNWKLMLGAGIVVYAEGSDMVEQTLACTRFYQSESCGKCVPCRIGSKKLLDLIEDLVAGRATSEQVEDWRGRAGTVQQLTGGLRLSVTQAFRPGARNGVVQELAAVMRSTAICGLGNVAANPMTTLLVHFPDDVARYTRRADR